jgi:putative transport protein
MRDVRKGIDKPFTFARHVREGHQTLAMDDLRLAEGDLLTLVGAPEAVAEVTELLGEPSSTHLELDRSVLDFRRMTVSRREVVGIPLAQLALPQRLGGRITRVRRGDVDFVPTDDTRLEPGDRVRVIAPRERIAELTKFFGDSIRAISEVDMLPFGLGIAIGIAIGHVDIPLPFGLSFRLGMAGGPLVVGLVLGAVVRTGPLVWVLPGSANLTLRQFGLILFFATVGTRAGAEFFRVVTTPDGLVLASLGAGLTAGTAALTLVVGRKLLGLSSAALAGFLAGVHTQPAALTFAHERSGSERVAVHYAMVFPVATVAKILAVQVLLRVLGAA